MTRLTTTRLLASAALGAALIFPGAAYADGTRDTVVGIFSASFKALGAKDVATGDISGDDAKFTVSNVEITPPTGDKPVEIDEVTFIGAKPTADGGITADEVDFSGLKVSDAKGGLTIGKIKIKGYATAAPAKITHPAGTHFDRFEATEIEAGDDAMKVPVSYLLITASDYVNGVPHKGSVEMKGLVVPVKADDPQMKGLADLGYTELDVDANFAASWDEKAARLSFDNWAVSAKDAGSVKFSIAVGGVTAEVMKQLQTLNGNESAAMGILQGLSLESALFRVENSSLFDRALDDAAKKQGAKKEDLIQQGTAMLPMMLSAIQNPAFEKKIVDAVTAFAASPRSLTVTAAPAKPVPVAEIIGTAATAPQALPQLLGADITANK